MPVDLIQSDRDRKEMICSAADRIKTSFRKRTALPTAEVTIKSRVAKVKIAFIIHGLDM